MKAIYAQFSFPHRSFKVRPRSQFDRARRRTRIITAAALSDGLPGLDILQLHNFYNLFVGASDTWSAATCVPEAQENPGGGDVVERENERGGEIRDHIVPEIRAQVPTNSLEHGWRLEILIRQELLRKGSLQHAPALRAEGAKAWGD